LREQYCRQDEAKGLRSARIYWEISYSVDHAGIFQAPHA
jgi:hypothetical protein